MKKITLSLTVATALLLAIGVLQSSYAKAASQSNDSTNQNQIKIDNFSFAPATLTVAVGTKITWINKDDVPHTVVSTNKAFTHSPALDTDESFSYTFTKSGTYEYYCSVHPKMTGKVVVQ